MTKCCGRRLNWFRTSGPPLQSVSRQLLVHDPKSEGVASISTPRCRRGTECEKGLLIRDHLTRAELASQTSRADDVGEGGNVIFLSYSSHDGQEVEQLATDLKSSGIESADSEKIDVGDNIIAEIRKVSPPPTILLFGLTRYAVESGWWQKSGRPKYYDQINSGLVKVIPLLREDCCLPTFLQNKKYADFRTSYANGLAQLLKRLDHKHRTTANLQIRQYLGRW